MRFLLIVALIAAVTPCLSEELQTAVRAALDLSDEYVWIYTEQPRW